MYCVCLTITIYYYYYLYIFLLAKLNYYLYVFYFLTSLLISIQTCFSQTCSHELKRSKTTGLERFNSSLNTPSSPLNKPKAEASTSIPSTSESASPCPGVKVLGEQMCLDSLKTVLQVSIDTLRRHRPLQFVALVHINLLVDVCILDQVR